MNNAQKRSAPSTTPTQQQPPKRFQQQTPHTQTHYMDEEEMDVDISLEEEEEEIMLLRNEALASRLPIWRRPSYVSHSSNTIIFQQLEIDYVIDERNKELLPDASGGRAAILRIFGVTRQGHSVCCNVHGFEPYFYISCPPGMNVSRFENILKERMKESILRIETIEKRSIMYYQQQESLFLKIVVALPSMVTKCRGILERGIQIDGLGTMVFTTYESNVPFQLRFMIDCNIVGGNWIEAPTHRDNKAKKTMSYCQVEIDCLYSELVSHDPKGEYSEMAPFWVLSFDIECAGRKGLFPEPKHDPIIQIANLVTLQGEDKPFVRNIMTLKSCAPIVGVDVMSFDTEREVFLAWRDFVHEVDPDIIIGYNICKFDLPYLIERAEVLKIAEFSILGRIRNSRVRVKDTAFSSRQLGTRESKEVAIEGRVQFDLLQIMQRDYKLSSYSLNSVSAHFLGEQPIKLEFEKVYFPYLLISKKRYAGLLWTNAEKYDKMDTKGIETVRRDNCLLVKNLVTECLHKILIDRDISGAVAYAKNTISDLLMNRMDLSLLVITKGLTKTGDAYAVKAAHVELADRMHRRDASTAPSVGDRVPYVIIKAAKGAKAYEKSEDPIYVLENNIPIDAQYYLQNQIEKPLLRVFEPILKNANQELLHGSHTRSVFISTPSNTGIMKFAKKQLSCLGCKALISNADQTLCPHCKGREAELYCKTVANVTELENLFGRLWTQCQECQGSMHQDVLCTSGDCPIFYRRKKAQKDMAEAQVQLSRWEF